MTNKVFTNDIIKELKTALVSIKNGSTTLDKGIEKWGSADLQINRLYNIANDALAKIARMEKFQKSK